MHASGMRIHIHTHTHRQTYIYTHTHTHTHTHAHTRKIICTLQEIVHCESALEGETYLERLPGRSDRPKNFPPFPKFCSLKPCCYFSIETEVPRSEQWKVYGLFALLICKGKRYNLLSSVKGPAHHTLVPAA